VLWDLSQVDPSDLSILLAGHGRMRIGFAEINPPETGEPSESHIAEAVHGCWQNTFCAFSKPVGTSLVCIQGDWSNLVDAKIKGGLAALALGDAAANPYNPLYARAFQTPKPWGVTALFTEHTGVHEPLALEWSARMSATTQLPTPSEPLVAGQIDDAAPVEGRDDGSTLPGADSPVAAPAPAAASNPEPEPTEPVPALSPDRRVAEAVTTFETVWDFAKALNRADRAALHIAADEREPEIPIDGLEVKKLLGTFWFKSVFPQLSGSWRERLLAALAERVEMPNHVMRLGRQAVRLRDLSYDQLREISAKTLVRGSAGTDLQLLLAVGNLWGEEAFSRLRFVDVAEPEEASRFAALLGLR
jgi:hypothetical protein